MQKTERSKTDFLFADKRLLTNAKPFEVVLINMIKTDHREYRYEERDDMFHLKRWHDGEETSWRGYIYSRPQWLEAILNTAMVGGHLKRVNQPPPNAIVWFTTDLDNNLITFLELT
jgi:hypothetical protein